MFADGSNVQTRTVRVLARISEPRISVLRATCCVTCRAKETLSMDRRCREDRLICRKNRLTYREKIVDKRS